MRNPGLLQGFGERQQVQVLQETVRRLYGRQAVFALQKLFPKIYPSDLAQILGSFSEDDAHKLFLLIPSATLAANTLKQLPVPLQAHLLREVDHIKMISVLEGLPPDDRADILGRMDAQTAKRFMKGLDEESLKEVEELLQYSPDTAGGMMTSQFFALSERTTVGNAIEAVRNLPYFEMVFYLYVLDDNQRLVGVSSLRQLILAEPHKILQEIMNPRTVSARTNTPRAEIADLIRHYRLLALPVVDDMDTLVGLVTVDDVFEAIEQEVTDDMFKMAGSPIPELESDSLWGTFVARAPWLLAALGGGLAACGVIDFVFDHVKLTQAMLLAIFIPLVMNTASQVGTISATASVRNLMTGGSTDALGRMLLRELALGLLLGAVFGSVSWLLAWLLIDAPLVHKVVALTVWLNTALSSVIAKAVPYLMQKFDRNPASATGPLLYGALDVMGIVNYFLVTLLLAAK